MISMRATGCSGMQSAARHAFCPSTRSHVHQGYVAARVPAPQRSRSVLARAAPVQDRVLGSLPYLCPLFDGLRYGKFLFLQFPVFQKLLAPLNPLLSLYFQIPFASIVVFFAVYLGLVNNQNMSRNVRFNAMQAILLDILLIIPSVVERLFRPPLGGFGLDLYVVVYNTIFLYIFCSVAYGVGSCIAGTTARIPLVANAAEEQIRYR